MPAWAAGAAAPSLADFGQKTVAGGALFVEEFGAAAAVVAHAGGRDQYFGRGLEAGEGFAEEARPLRSAVADAGFALWRPAARRNVFAGEVDHGVEAFKAAGVQAAIGGVPRDFMGAAGRAAHEAGEVIAAALEGLYEGLADEARGAGYEDFHGVA